MVPVTLVCGPPGAGKSTYVAKHKGPLDLVLDVDHLFRALTLLDDREKPTALLPFVLEARDAVIRLLASGFLGPDRAWLIMGGENNEIRADLTRRLKADVVVLPVPVGECRQRMASQGRPDWHIREVVDVGVKWHRQFQMMPHERIIEDAMPQVGLDGWHNEA